MPWNGSGVFNRTDGTRTGATVWAQAKAAGVKITTAGHDTHDEDLATGLEACLNRNGENSPTANIAWGGFKITGLADGDADGDAIAYDQSAVRFTSTDAGADAGPVVTLYRNSATPAADDLLGEIRMDGEDSAGNQQEYLNIQGQIAAATSGSESARLLFNLLQGGTEREIFRLNGADSGVRIKGYGTGATVGPVLTLHRDTSSPADADVLGGINFDGEDDGSTQTTYAGIDAVTQDVTDGTEDGYLRFKAIRAGSEVISLSPGILYTAQATTSGSSVDFSDIPAQAREIIISFSAVSLSGTDSVIVQLGVSGTPVTTGYAGESGHMTNAAETAVFTVTSGFPIRGGTDGLGFTGHMHLTHMGGNLWIASHNGRYDTSVVVCGGGGKTLAGALDMVRITRNGTDSFDAGSVTILVK